jgi:hypothetical protein
MHTTQEQVQRHRTGWFRLSLRVVSLALILLTAYALWAGDRSDPALLRDVFVYALGSIFAFLGTFVKRTA